jgi:hypothetical protein
MVYLHDKESIAVAEAEAKRHGSLLTVCSIMPIRT